MSSKIEFAVMANQTADQRNDYAPSWAATKAAEPIAESIFEKNGSPETMTLDQAGLTRILAFTLDIAIGALRKGGDI